MVVVIAVEADELIVDIGCVSVRMRADTAGRQPVMRQQYGIARTSVTAVSYTHSLILKIAMLQCLLQVI